MQHCLNAFGTIGTLIGADSCVRRSWRKIAVAQFAVGSKLQHFTACGLVADADLVAHLGGGINDTMPSISAKPFRLRSFEPLNVVILLYQRTKLLDVTGPMQVFCDVKHSDGRSAYNVVLASLAGGPVITDAGLPLSTISVYEVAKLRVDTLLVSGGSAALREASNEELGRWLARMRCRVRRFGSICLGAFILAAHGFLDNHRVTTHWEKVS